MVSKKLAFIDLLSVPNDWKESVKNEAELSFLFTTCVTIEAANEFDLDIAESKIKAGLKMDLLIHALKR